MSVLRIDLVPWAGRSGDGAAYEIKLWDLLIDGRPLAEHLGFLRADLSLCGSPLEGADRAALTDYARQLLWEVPGQNQFGSGRVVLYRCHCGCDYCGVISARVVRERGAVRWADVGPEDGGGACGTAEFRFRTRQAAAAVAGFLRRRRGAAAGKA